MILPIAIIGFVRNITPSSLEMWFQLRREAGLLDGSLEFPGGKIERGELPFEASIRECEEEANIERSYLRQQRFCFTKIYQHRYPDREVLIYPFFCLANPAGLPQGGWYEINTSDLEELVRSKNMLQANRQIIKDLLGYMQNQQQLGLLEQTWLPYEKLQSFFFSP